MGKIIQYSRLSKQNSNGIMKPLIFCNFKYCEEGRTFAINQALAEELIKIKPEKRSMRLIMCFDRVLSKLPDNAMIKDFDVMFNPCYQVDVLQLFIAEYRKKPFSVLWPGKLEDGKLIYAEDGYSDHKEYEISEYDITCVM